MLKHVSSTTERSEQDNCPARPFEAEPLHAFSDYMESIRVDGGCARFDRVQLMDIYKVAPNLYIFDIDHGSGKWTFRYGGTKLAEAYGRDLTGLEVRDVMSNSPNMEGWLVATERMIAERRPLWTRNTIAKDADAPGVRNVLIAYERVAYPLLGKEDRVDHVIGVIHISRAVADHPYESRLFD